MAEASVHAERVVVLDVSPENTLDAGGYSKDIVSVLNEIGYQNVEVVYLPSDHRRAIAEVRRRQRNTLMFVNLYDCSDPCGQLLVDYMEEHGIPFTGAGPRFYDPTRETMKRVCRAAGVNVTPYSIVVHADEIDDELPLRLGDFPLFVKPEHGYDSVGVDQASKVSDIRSLRDRAQKVCDQHGGALIEPYLQGREFSVLILSGCERGEAPTVFPALEYVFPADRPADSAFITFDDKWGAVFEPRWRLVQDEKLDTELQEMTRKTFVAFDGYGIARLDIREDVRTGKLYVMDVNANPSCFYVDEGTADTCLRLCGWPKSRLLQILIDQGLARAKRFHDANAVKVVHTEGRGSALVATRDVAAGQILYRCEEQSTRLVSAQFVEEVWTAEQKEEFSRYAYPVGDGIFAFWDQNPLNWRPINHSCDPNAWQQGLDVVARRDIHKDDELTLDYATFCTNFPPFVCWCGSDMCRREKCLQPGEYKEQWFKQRYRGHCSPYVEALMRRHDGENLSVL
eukprot:TRINITY_DN9461_c0_g1_i1.p1 TRINITY_DN9461_c0_g1~~TRINITY_DN9461_c0_g1_i1.p1  ORF type:complete len:524 (-),score=98.97 TRINITY_DN9461_c0_g1_i1:63-1595(-)